MHGCALWTIPRPTGLACDAASGPGIASAEVASYYPGPSPSILSCTSFSSPPSWVSLRCPSSISLPRAPTLTSSVFRCLLAGSFLRARAVQDVPSILISSHSWAYLGQSGQLVSQCLPASLTELYGRASGCCATSLGHDVATALGKHKILAAHGRVATRAHRAS